MSENESEETKALWRGFEFRGETLRHIATQLRIRDAGKMSGELLRDTIIEETRRQAARIEALEAALWKAKDTFRRYAALHASKSFPTTPENARKAQDNHALAEMCERAIIENK